MLLDPAWYFYIFWFPEYLKRARHFSMASIGKYAWIPFGVAGLGNHFGGMGFRLDAAAWMSLNIARKGGVTLFAVLMTSAIPGSSGAGRSYFHCFSVILPCWVTPDVVPSCWRIPADVFPKNLVGSIFGLASMGAGLGGMIFALLTGWVLDHYSYVPVFVGFGVLPLVSAGVLWTLLGPISPESGSGAI